MQARELAQRLMHEEKIDFLEMSLWDVFKAPAEEPHRGRSLLSYFTDLERGDVRLGGQDPWRRTGASLPRCGG
jgi:hypothetical protein